MKYNFNSLESNFIDELYDTLFANTNWPQFNPENAHNFWVNSAEGQIEMDYYQTKIVVEGGKVKTIPPRKLKVKITFDIN